MMIGQSRGERESRRALTPEVVAARIDLRVAELRVLAARTFVLAARAQESHHIPSDIRLAARADVARATAIAKRKQR